MVFSLLFDLFLVGVLAFCFWQLLGIRGALVELHENCVRLLAELQQRVPGDPITEGLRDPANYGASADVLGLTPKGFPR